MSYELPRINQSTCILPSARMLFLISSHKTPKTDYNPTGHVDVFDNPNDPM